MEQDRCRRRGELAPAARWCLAALVLVAACRTSPPPKPLPPPAPEPVAVAPAWTTQALSWEKLAAIERWLDTEAASHDDGLRIEGELQLNEGRLRFSQEDLKKNAAPDQTVRVRIDAAKTAFERIGKDKAASPGQKARATIGLQGAIALLGTPPKPGLVLVTREQWGARPGVPSRLTPLKGAWSRITVHHSVDALSEASDGTLADSESTVRAIQKFHMTDENHMWGDIGYHFLIDSSGRIFEGRELQWQGAHAGGANGINNNQNLGICMLGNFLHKSPSSAALKSLEVLLDDLCNRYKIPRSRIYPHHKFTTTECPGPAITSWLRAHD
jgi:hypothetical protein